MTFTPQEWQQFAEEMADLVMLTMVWSFIAGYAVCWCLGRVLDRGQENDDEV